MVGGIKLITTRIIETLDQMIKSTGDVIRFEKEAVEASKIMQEAPMHANFAKANMISVKIY